MAGRILRIAQMGHPLLRETSKIVEDPSSAEVKTEVTPKGRTTIARKNERAWTWINITSS